MWSRERSKWVARGTSSGQLQRLLGRDPSQGLGVKGLGFGVWRVYRIQGFRGFVFGVKGPKEPCWFGDLGLSFLGCQPTQGLEM